MLRLSLTLFVCLAVSRPSLSRAFCWRSRKQTRSMYGSTRTTHCTLRGTATKQLASSRRSEVSSIQISRCRLIQTSNHTSGQIRKAWTRETGRKPPRWLRRRLPLDTTINRVLLVSSLRVCQVGIVRLISPWPIYLFRSCITRMLAGGLFRSRSAP